MATTVAGQTRALDAASDGLAGILRTPLTEPEAINQDRANALLRRALGNERTSYVVFDALPTAARLHQTIAEKKEALKKQQERLNTLSTSTALTSDQQTELNQINARLTEITKLVNLTEADLQDDARRRGAHIALQAINDGFVDPRFDDNTPPELDTRYSQPTVAFVDLIVDTAQTIDAENIDAENIDAENTRYLQYFAGHFMQQQRWEGSLEAFRKEISGLHNDYIETANKLISDEDLIRYPYDKAFVEKNLDQLYADQKQRIKALNRDLTTEINKITHEMIQCGITLDTARDWRNNAIQNLAGEEGKQQKQLEEQHEKTKREAHRYNDLVNRNVQARLFELKQTDNFKDTQIAQIWEKNKKEILAEILPPLPLIQVPTNDNVQIGGSESYLTQRLRHLDVAVPAGLKLTGPKDTDNSTPIKIHVVMPGGWSGKKTEELFLFNSKHPKTGVIKSEFSKTAHLTGDARDEAYRTLLTQWASTGYRLNLKCSPPKDRKAVLRIALECNIPLDRIDAVPKEYLEDLPAHLVGGANDEKVKAIMEDRGIGDSFEPTPETPIPGLKKLVRVPGGEPVFWAPLATYIDIDGTVKMGAWQKLVPNEQANAFTLHTWIPEINDWDQETIEDVELGDAITRSGKVAYDHFDKTWYLYRVVQDVDGTQYLKRYDLKDYSAEPQTFDHETQSWTRHITPRDISLYSLRAELVILQRAYAENGLAAQNAEDIALANKLSDVIREIDFYSAEIANNSPRAKRQRANAMREIRHAREDIAKARYHYIKREVDGTPHAQEFLAESAPTTPYAFDYVPPEVRFDSNNPRPANIASEGNQADDGLGGPNNFYARRQQNRLNRLADEFGDGNDPDLTVRIPTPAWTGGNASVPNAIRAQGTAFFERLRAATQFAEAGQAVPTEHMTYFEDVTPVIRQATELAGEAEIAADDPRWNDTLRRSMRIGVPPALPEFPTHPQFADEFGGGDGAWDEASSFEGDGILGDGPGVAGAAAATDGSGPGAGAAAGGPTGSSGLPPAAAADGSGLDAVVPRTPGAGAGGGLGAAAGAAAASAPTSTFVAAAGSAAERAAALAAGAAEARRHEHDGPTSAAADPAGGVGSSVRDGAVLHLDTPHAPPRNVDAAPPTHPAQGDDTSGRETPRTGAPPEAALSDAPSRASSTGAGAAAGGVGTGDDADFDTISIRLRQQRERRATGDTGDTLTTRRGFSAEADLSDPPAHADSADGDAPFGMSEISGVGSEDGPSTPPPVSRGRAAATAPTGADTADTAPAASEITRQRILNELAAHNKTLQNQSTTFNELLNWVLPDLDAVSSSMASLGGFEEVNTSGRAERILDDSNLRALHSRIKVALYRVAQGDTDQDLDRLVRELDDEDLAILRAGLSGGGADGSDAGDEASLDLDDADPSGAALGGEPSRKPLPPVGGAGGGAGAAAFQKPGIANMGYGTGGGTHLDAPMGDHPEHAPGEAPPKPAAPPRARGASARPVRDEAFDAVSLDGSDDGDSIVADGNVQNRIDANRAIKDATNALANIHGKPAADLSDRLTRLLVAVKENVESGESVNFESLTHIAKEIAGISTNTTDSTRTLPDELEALEGMARRAGFLAEAGAGPSTSAAPPKPAPPMARPAAMDADYEADPLAAQKTALIARISAARDRVEEMRGQLTDAGDTYNNRHITAADRLITNVHGIREQRALEEMAEQVTHFERETTVAVNENKLWLAKLKKRNAAADRRPGPPPAAVRPVGGRVEDDRVAADAAGSVSDGDGGFEVESPHTEDLEAGLQDDIPGRLSALTAEFKDLQQKASGQQRLIRITNGAMTALNTLNTMVQSGLLSVEQLGELNAFLDEQQSALMNAGDDARAVGEVGLAIVGKVQELAAALTNRAVILAIGELQDIGGFDDDDDDTDALENEAARIFTQLNDLTQTEQEALLFILEGIHAKYPTTSDSDNDRTALRKAAAAEVHEAVRLAQSNARSTPATANWERLVQSALHATKGKGLRDALEERERRRAEAETRRVAERTHLGAATTTTSGGGDAPSNAPGTPPPLRPVGIDASQAVADGAGNTSGDGQVVTSEMHFHFDAAKLSPRDKLIHAMCEAHDMLSDPAFADHEHFKNKHQQQLVVAANRLANGNNSIGNAGCQKLLDKINKFKRNLAKDIKRQTKADDIDQRREETSSPLRTPHASLVVTRKDWMEHIYRTLLDKGLVTSDGTDKAEAATYDNAMPTTRTDGTYQSQAAATASTSGGGRRHFRPSGPSMATKAAEAAASEEDARLRALREREDAAKRIREGARRRMNYNPVKPHEVGTLRPHPGGESSRSANATRDSSGHTDHNKPHFVSDGHGGVAPTPGVEANRGRLRKAVLKKVHDEQRKGDHGSATKQADYIAKEEGGDTHVTHGNTDDVTSRVARAATSEAARAAAAEASGSDGPDDDAASQASRTPSPGNSGGDRGDT